MPLTKIKSLGITDGTIVNADINASAAIAGTKISGSFGKVLQVVTATDSTQRGTTSTSFVLASSTLTLSITPSSASSKIFIISSTYWGNTSSGISTFGTIFRDSTDLGSASNKGLCHHYSNGGNRSAAICMTLDSPSTTSAITYEFRHRVESGTSQINFDSCEGSITAFEIGA